MSESEKDFLTRLRDTEDVVQFAKPIQMDAADEIKRLRAENERQQAEIECLQRHVDGRDYTISVRAARISELECENERLREAVRTALDSDYDRREDRGRQILEQIKKRFYEAGQGP